MKKSEQSLHDIFICHASEDKELFVRSLAEALRRENLDVWYDEFSLKLGDSLRRSIDKGLKSSRFGVVVLSPSFFAKRWTEYELDGLLEKEISRGEAVILPVWHKVSHNDVAAYSPSLAGRVAVSSANGISAVVNSIADVLRPQGSPLCCKGRASCLGSSASRGDRSVLARRRCGVESVTSNGGENSRRIDLGAMEFPLATKRGHSQ